LELGEWGMGEWGNWGMGELERGGIYWDFIGLILIF